MTVEDLLDGAFRVLKARPRTVLGVAAAILVPVGIVGAFLRRAALRGTVIGVNLTSLTTPQSGGQVLATYVAAALSAASLFFLGGALARLVTAWYAGGDLDAGEALGAAFRRTPALLGAFLVLLPVKALGAAACGIGLIFVVPLFALTAPAIVVEDLGPVAGAKRSWQLVTRRYWWCVLIIVVATIGTSIMDFALTVLPSSLCLLLPGSIQWVGQGLVQSAAAVVLITTLTSVSVLLYIDLRIRTEGLDLELGAADAFAHAS